MSGNSTITLQNRLNFASTHGDLLPLANVGGFGDEPGLTLCNDAISELISSPNDWKFNRVDMAMLISCPNKQDQRFGGASVFTLNFTGTNPSAGWQSQGWGIALASNNGIVNTTGTVVVTTLEQHRIPVGAQIFMIGNANPAYNSIFTDNGSSSGWSGGWTVTAVTATTLIFTATAGMTNGDKTGAPGITDYGYLTSVAFQEINNTSSPPNINPGTTYRELPYTSIIGQPCKISVMRDHGDGTLTIRWALIPGQATWGARMVYQAKAPLKVALTDTWSPIPDNYQAVINQALLYRMYRYLNDAKADSEYAKLQKVIAKVQGTDDVETTDVHIQPPCLMSDGDYLGYW